VGSYSLFCGLSGLEIGEQEPCYVVMLSKAQFDYWSYDQAIPPVRGTYGDSGYLDVKESPEFCAAWQVPYDSSWSVLDHHPDMMPMWIAGPVFDHLAQLPSTEGELLHVAIAEYMERMGVGVRKNLAHARRTAAAFADHPDQEGVAELIKLHDYTFTAGRDCFTTEILPSVGDDAVRMFNAGVDPEILLQGYARAVLLYRGSRELRKPLYPANGSYGPQHGGGLAMVSFCTKVLQLAAERAKEDIMYTEGYSGDE
jgi:hypothetical protein